MMLEFLAVVNDDAKDDDDDKLRECSKDKCQNEVNFLWRDETLVLSLIFPTLKDLHLLRVIFDVHALLA
jgi:hypothetical protein